MWSGGVGQPGPIYRIKEEQEYEHSYTALLLLRAFLADYLTVRLPASQPAYLPACLSSCPPTVRLPARPYTRTIMFQHSQDAAMPVSYCDAMVHQKHSNHSSYIESSVQSSRNKSA